MPLSPTSWPSGSASAASVLFDSALSGAAASIDTGAAVITSGFRCVVVLAYLRTTEAVTLSSFAAIVNDDSSALYDRARVRNLNATVTGTNVLAGTSWAVNTPGASATAGVFGSHVFTIPNYDGGVGNKYGSLESGVAAQAAADALVELYSLGYRATTAISRFKVTASGGANFVTGSRLTVLGY